MTVRSCAHTLPFIPGKLEFPRKGMKGLSQHGQRLVKVISCKRREAWKVSSGCGGTIGCTCLFEHVPTASQPRPPNHGCSPLRLGNLPCSLRVSYLICRGGFT